MTDQSTQAVPVGQGKVNGKGQKTRKLLLEAAGRVFVQQGYVKAEISQITRSAGKSIGVFYAYFNNKAEVLASLVDDFVVEVHNRVAKPSNRPEDLRFVLENIWTTYKSHAATLLALSDAAAVDGAFAATLQRLRTYAREDFTGMIKAQQACGYCLGLDATFTALALETMLNQCLNEWLGQGLGAFADAAQERRAFETLASIFEIVLHARLPAAAEDAVTAATR